MTARHPRPKTEGVQPKVSPRFNHVNPACAMSATYDKTSLLTQAPFSKEGRLLPNDSLDCTTPSFNTKLARFLL
jgi:hypothetical protein